MLQIETKSLISKYLIVKWEELGGGGSSKEEEGGGSLIARRKSSEFLQRLSFFEEVLEADDPNKFQNFNFNSVHISNGSKCNITESKSDSVIPSHKMRGEPLLAKTRTNGKHVEMREIG